MKHKYVKRLANYVYIKAYRCEQHMCQTYYIGCAKGNTSAPFDVFHACIPLLDFINNIKAGRLSATQISVLLKLFFKKPKCYLYI